jgi:hypothetical protein
MTQIEWIGTDFFIPLADIAELRRFLFKKHRAKKQQRLSLLTIDYSPSATSALSASNKTSRHCEELPVPQKRESNLFNHRVK